MTLALPTMEELLKMAPHEAVNTIMDHHLEEAATHDRPCCLEEVVDKLATLVDDLAFFDFRRLVGIQRRSTASWCHGRSLSLRLGARSP